MKILKGEEACNRKKGNMAMWDAIDDLTEEYLRKLLEFSEKKVNSDNIEYFDEKLLDIGKEVTEKVINLLEEDLDAEFVYADCDF